MRHTSPRLFVATIAVSALLAPSLAFAVTTMQSTPASSDAATSKPSRKTAECAAGGFTIEHEPTWLAQIEGAMVLLIPSLDAVDEQDPEFYAASSTDCADPTKVADDAGFDALLLASFQGASKLVRKGAVERSGDGVMSARYEATDEAGQTRPVYVACRVVGGKFVSILALASEKSVAARAATAKSLCKSVRTLGTPASQNASQQASQKPDGGAAVQSDVKSDKPSDAPATKPTDAIAADGTKETVNELGGYAFRHDAKWRVETDGPATIVLAAMPAAEGELAEFYAVTGVPWEESGPLTNNDVALKAARQLLGSLEIEREGDVEPLPGGGMLFRSSVTAADGSRIGVRVLARVEKARIVGIGLLAKPADLPRQEEVARGLFKSVRFVPVKEVVGTADPEFVGTWSTEEVLSAGGGFDAGGAATMVTERTLVLGADGRFSISSRTAGGGSGLTFESPAGDRREGTWSVTRTGDRATLRLRGNEGDTTAVPCAIFEGKLVLGPAGERKFFTRVR